MAKRYDPIMCMMVDEPTKAQDVAPATQRYINTIVDESKAKAEKFVRQAEQDDEVPENELKYVYKAYNEKFGYKFHDSASALDKAIKACDANPEKVAELFKSYYNGRVTAEKLKNVSKSDLGALEWSVKQIPRLIKQGKPSHLINTENMQIERILKSYGII